MIEKEDFELNAKEVALLLSSALTIGIGLALAAAYRFKPKKGKNNVDRNDQKRDS